jgi:L-ribulose-5-phosphate 3-epimerase
MSSISSRLAVCTWSLQPTSPADLLAKLDAIGIRRIQLALDPLIHEPAVWGDFPALAAKAGIEIVSGMFGNQGEDYTTLESIRVTGGLVPDERWDENWNHVQAVAALAARIGLKLVSFHAGFLPHSPNDPAFVKLAWRIRQVAEHFAAKGIALAMETGQETAAGLKEFLVGLKLANLGVNFDPANMILYGKGDPIDALRTLGPWLKQCHIKDATATKVPGTWGAEVVAGTGEVDWKAFFTVLAELGFKGDLSIEREAGDQRVADIKTARTFVLGLVG